MSASASSNLASSGIAELNFLCYGNEPDRESLYLPAVRKLISKDLSEPYSIYVYRYFLYEWANLCFMALTPDGSLVGVIICKLEVHRGGPLRGYIAMLATRSEWRGKGIATRLVKMAIDKMRAADADEIALETEVDNTPSLRIYENLGFLRTKRLHRYYLSGTTAYRLILYLKPGIPYVMTQMQSSEHVQPLSAADNISEDLFVRQAAQIKLEEDQVL